MTGTHIHGLYHAGVELEITPEAGLASVDVNLLHRRMGHISIPRIEQMVRHGQLKGIDAISGTPDFCEPCTLGKMKKLPFTSQDEVRASRPLQIVHSDVGGPISPQSQDGYKYWLLIVDDYSRFPWIYFLKKKSDVLAMYNTWKADVRALFKQEIDTEELSEMHTQFLRSDGGGEYTGVMF
jgi:hypothetical protein